MELGPYLHRNIGKGTADIDTDPNLVPMFRHFLHSCSVNELLRRAREGLFSTCSDSPRPHRQAAAKSSSVIDVSGALRGG
jgi:hypothetical protein